MNFKQNLNSIKFGQFDFLWDRRQISELSSPVSPMITKANIQYKNNLNSQKNISDPNMPLCNTCKGIQHQYWTFFLGFCCQAKFLAVFNFYLCESGQPQTNQSIIWLTWTYYIWFDGVIKKSIYFKNTKFIFSTFPLYRSYWCNFENSHLI